MSYTADVSFAEQYDKLIPLKNEGNAFKVDLQEVNVASNSDILAAKVSSNEYFMLPLRRINTTNRFYAVNDFNARAIFASSQAIRNSSSKAVWAIPTMQQNTISHLQVPILCYHVISEDKSSTMYTPYWKFEEHLKALQDNGYTAITPQQLYEAYYLNKELPQKPIMITFDDGYYDNYTLGYPLLQKYNMQATIFIIASLIDEHNNESSTGGLPRLSWDNIRTMQSHVTVQSHTFNSHSKTKGPKGREVGMIATPMNVDGQWETDTQYWIRIGKDFLAAEKLMKEKVGYGSYIFSYPYGQFSEITKKVLEQMEIPLAVTIQKDIATSASDVYAIPRIIVNGNWSGQQLLSHLY